MGNIVGEPTKKYVINQVNKRQQIHGTVERTNEELLYLNTKTAYVRLASSVYVEDDIKGFSKSGNQLAKEYVLFGGTSKVNTSQEADPDNNIPKKPLSIQQRSGIARDSSQNNLNAYGLGGLEFGLSPMMGLTQAYIKSENRGSLRTATVDIIANNKYQFEIIETLYIKLGYLMLLEWGWTNFYTSSGGYFSNPPTTVLDKFLKRELSFNQLLTAIEKERANTEGNYDGFIGKVVNFNWTFTKEGQYKITLILRSVGDVIESLKMNTLLPGDAKELNDKQKQLNLKEKEAIDNIDGDRIADAQSRGETTTTLVDGTVVPVNRIVRPDNTSTAPPIVKVLDENGNIVLKNQYQLDQEQREENRQELGEIRNEQKETISIKHTIANELFKYKRKADDQDNDSDLLSPSSTIPGSAYFITSEESNKTTPIKERGSTVFIKRTYETEIKNEDESFQVGAFYFIQFKKLLEIIQNKLIPTIKKGSSRFINVDTSEENFILIPNNFVSSNLNICNFKNKFTLGDTEEEGEEISTMVDAAEDFAFSQDKNTYGKLLNIYFNVSYINNIMDRLVNSEGDVIMIDLLDAMLRDFCIATGGYNNLVTTVDPDTNYIRFIDETTSPINNEETVFFEMFGYRGSGKERVSNIIRDYNFNTTVSPSLSTMITVGATSKGYSPGYDATGLRAINYGTYDAIKKELINDDLEEASQDENDKKLKSLEEKYKSAIIARRNYIQNINISKYLQSSAMDFQSSFKSIIEYEQYKSTVENGNKYSGSPTIGFIPFDLGLTLDGLSGIKIYNKIEVDTFFLPQNYPESLEFIVKGVDHTIAQNDWTTQLSTLAVPKNPTGTNTKNRLGGRSGSNSGHSSGNTNSKLNVIQGRYVSSQDNNPYNIRPIGSAINFNGVTGQKQGFRGSNSVGYFLVFDTINNGVRAGMLNLLNTYFKRGINTVPSIINKYAPPSDGNNSQQYINSVINLMKPNLKGTKYANLTRNTTIPFKGPDETDKDTIKAFKELNKAILRIESGITSSSPASSTVDNFDIQKLRSV